MKKTKIILCAAMVMFAMLFSACKSCSKPTPEPKPVFAGYNLDEVITSDYNRIDESANVFVFREVDAYFDSVLSESNCNTINYIATKFQCGAFVNMIFHTPDTTMLNKIVDFANGIETEKEYTIDTNTLDYTMWLRFADVILECGPLAAHYPVTFDSCMSIMQPYRDQLHTRALTIRCLLEPGTPDNGLYIFGTGIYAVNAVTGEVYSNI